MGLTIRERGDTIATLRFVSVHLMETLARWVPTTPELEAKTLFGKHIWDFAQHADVLGKRTFELRAPLHYTRPPRADYLLVLESLAAADRTAERVHGLYDGILPDLEIRYRRYLDETDRLLDEPSLRVIERILGDFPRLSAEREALSRERPDLALADRAWPQRLAAQARASGFVEPREPAEPTAQTA